MRRLLVPVLTLALVGGLFWWTSRDQDSPLHRVESDVSLCKERLRTIYTGLIAYEVREGQAPQETGLAFLGSLFTSGIWEDSAEQRALLRCPGPGARSIELPQLSAPSAKLDSTLGALETSYTVADFAAKPLTDFPTGGPELRALVACASDQAMAHAGALNVLYSDGSVKTLLLERLIEAGTLPAGSPRLPLGPASPLEELRDLLAP